MLHFVASRRVETLGAGLIVITTVLGAPGQDPVDGVIVYVAVIGDPVLLFNISVRCRGSLAETLTPTIP